MGWLGIRCSSGSTSSAATAFWRPIVLDLVLFLDLAKRAGRQAFRSGSRYFKSPMTRQALSRTRDSVHPADEAEEHVRYLRGEELITHLGLSITIEFPSSAHGCQSELTTDD